MGTESFCKNTECEIYETGSIECLICPHNGAEATTTPRSIESARPPCYDAKAKNRYGVDIAYFRKEFAKLSRDLDNYTPVELARYLERLMDVAAS
jgi:hypothetical protein